MAGRNAAFNAFPAYRSRNPAQGQWVSGNMARSLAAYSLYVRGGNHRPGPIPADPGLSGDEQAARPCERFGQTANWPCAKARRERPGAARKADIGQTAGPEIKVGFWASHVRSFADAATDHGRRAGGARGAFAAARD